MTESQFLDLILTGFGTTLGYIFVAGATAPFALVLGIVLVGPLALRRGLGWWKVAAQKIGMFLAVLFLSGIPANVVFTLFMRERYYTDRDPIVDWIPWIPSGDWIIDWACGGRYLQGASASTLRAAWAVLAVPVWIAAILVYRTIASRVRNWLAL